MIQLLNTDCIQFMRQQPDKSFDLAVVDPPYGINISKKDLGRKKWGRTLKKSWDSKPPDKEYFTELFRVSKNQIIFGGNFFDLPKTTAWLVWDKMVAEKSDFGKVELAWTSYSYAGKIVHLQYSGFLGADSDCRIHPTQKPIALYKWIFEHYAQKGFRILDTHLGSASSAIAARIAELDFVGTEIDADFFNSARTRYENYFKSNLFYVI